MGRGEEGAGMGDGGVFHHYTEKKNMIKIISCWC